MAGSFPSMSRVTRPAQGLSSYGEQISTVLCFGASIINQSFGSSAKLYDAKLQLAKYGINADVFNHGVSGETMADFLLRIDSVIATQAGKSGVLFHMHGPGNDVTSTRPFVTSTDAERKQIVDGIRTIARKVRAAGFTFSMSNISRRYYDGLITYPEDQGSLPYNTNLIEPLIREICPYMWDSSRNEPKINMYRILGDDFTKFEADRIHPNDDGEYDVRRETCKGIGSVFGRAIPQYNPVSGARVVFGLGRSTPYTNPSINQANVSTVGNSLGLSTFGLGSVVYVTDYTAVNRGGRGNAGVTTATWDNDEVQQASVFTELDPFPNGGVEQITHTIGNIKPGTTGTMTVSGSRSTTLDIRVTEITYNGESKTYDVKSTLPVSVQFDFVVDTSGEITFTQNAAIGSVNSYVSSVQLDFN